MPPFFIYMWVSFLFGCLFSILFSSNLFIYWFQSNKARILCSCSIFSHSNYYYYFIFRSARQIDSEPKHKNPKASFFPLLYFPFSISHAVNANGLRLSYYFLFVLFSELFAPFYKYEQSSVGNVYSVVRIPCWFAVVWTPCKLYKTCHIKWTRHVLAFSRLLFSHFQVNMTRKNFWLFLYTSSMVSFFSSSLTCFFRLEIFSFLLCSANVIFSLQKRQKECELWVNEICFFPT